MIGRSDDDAVRVVLLKELKERVQYAPNFPDLVSSRALPTQSIELVEEVDRPGLLN